MIERPSLHIRETNSDDLDDIRAIHQSAFPAAERDSVTRLAIELARTASESASISLLAGDQSQALGHVVFSPTGIADVEWLKVCILSPLAVKTEAQRGGIGSMLVQEGLQRLKARGVAIVLVYGDPQYYARFGFDAELGERFLPPHPLQYPFGWQAMALEPAVKLPDQPVQTVCAQPLDDPAMW